MKRLRYVFDKARVRRLESEGLGQGAGEMYRPWRQIQVERSSGPSRLSRRPQRFYLSESCDRSSLCALWFEFDPSVLDVREQLPLDRLVTRRAAQALGLMHSPKRGQKP